MLGYDGRARLDDGLLHVLAADARTELRGEVRERVLEALHAVAHVHLVAVGESVVVAVRAEVGLVLDVLEEEEEDGSERGSAQRRNPVDPVVAAGLALDKILLPSAWERWRRGLHTPARPYLR